MPETDTSTTTDAAATEAQTTDSGTEEVDWKAKAREWEAKSKANHKLVQELQPKAQQFEALQAASQTELERAQAQAQALQADLEKTQRQALIASVALDKGLPATLARRLQGDTREDLEADADELLSQFPQQSSEPRAPRVDPSQGSSARGGGAKTPAEEFAALIQSQTGR